MLSELAAELRQTLGLLHKRDIQPVARHLGAWVPDNTTQQPIWLGDDCAAIPDGEGYLLLAAEGMWSVLVETEPWFAGWCGVLVNVSDIYAMGGQTDCRSRCPLESVHRSGGATLARDESGISGL